MRQVSREGIELIKRFEGLELQAYQDVAGIWTIGYGHTGPEVGPGMVITEGQAEQLLIEDLERFERGVSSAVQAPITQTQFDALVSLAYNIGVAGFSRSTAVKRLNKGDFEGAAEAITWWNKATINGRKQPVAGLTRRRAAEAALFLQDFDDGIPGGSAGMRIEEASPRRKNPMNSRTVGGATTAGAGGAVAAGAAAMNGRDGNEGEAGEAGGPVVVKGDVDTPDAAPALDGETETADTETADAKTGTTADTGTQTADSGEDVPGTGGCFDRESGEYLTPPEAEAGRPLSPGGPIEADADPDALEEVDPPYCDDLYAEAGETEAIVVQNDPAPQPTERDVGDAVGIGAGALAVLAAIYTIAARIDDWVKFRR